MSLINVDLVNPEASERPPYEPIPTGICDLEIVNDLAVTPTNNPSSDGVNYGKIEVVLKDLETEKIVRDYLSCHPKMQWRINQFAKSAGVAEVEPGQVDLAEFKGRVVRASVAEDTYVGRDQKTKRSNKVLEYITE